jgi:hypothetical protein
VPNSFNKERTVSSTNGVVTTGFPHEKKMKLNPSLCTSPHKQKLSQNGSMKLKLQNSEDQTKVNRHALGFGKGFFDTTTKH